MPPPTGLVARDYQTTKMPHLWRFQLLRLTTEQNAVAADLRLPYSLRRRFVMSDQDIQKLENQFPAISSSAFAEARQKVLASGQSVLQTENGVIYEVFPDGRRVELKKIEPPKHFVPGSVFTIK